MRDVMQVRLPAPLQRQMLAQMESTYPDEGGGFLLGTTAGAQVDIQETLPVENVFDEAERHHRYAMTPQDWLRIEDQADRRGLSIVGYYHSHPDSPAIPSEFDRAHALPNFVYLITSGLAGRAAALLAWRLRDDRSRFDAVTLDIITR
jgi:proteasome lid subunit RPN8/RPN11